MKKDIIKVFIFEIYSSPPRKIYETNKIVYYTIDEIWSIDLADMTDYKNSNNKRIRYIFVMIDKFSKNLWCIPLKIKSSQMITNTFSNILSRSKGKPNELQSDRVAEICNSFFQLFLKRKIYNISHNSQIRDHL